MTTAIPHTPAAIKKLEEAGMEPRQAEAVVAVISCAKSQAGNRMLVSYKTLRRLVGVLGVTLPFVLAIGCIACSVCCTDFKNTISDYYHSNMADVFVGVLFTIGFFLFTYKGYEKRDDVTGDLACGFALGVALCPVNSPTEAIQTLHYISAILLFLTLSYFSIFIFTKTERGGRIFAWPKIRRCSGLQPEKLTRNRVYVACGVIMMGCIILICIYLYWLKCTWLDAWKPVFLLETLLLIAFGFSWFVKGETLWTDSEPQESLDAKGSSSTSERSQAKS